LVWVKKNVMFVRVRWLGFCWGGGLFLGKISWNCFLVPFVKKKGYKNITKWVDFSGVIRNVNPSSSSLLISEIYWRLAGSSFSIQCTPAAHITSVSCSAIERFRDIWGRSNWMQNCYLGGEVELGQKTLIEFRLSKPFMLIWGRRLNFVSFQDGLIELTREADCPPIPFYYFYF